MRLALAFTIVASVALAQPSPGPAVTVDSPSDRFIDDAFAMRADGKALAYVTTDGASLAELHLRELGGTDKTVPGAPPKPTALHWLGPARVLVVWRPADSEDQFAQAWNLKGAEKEKLGPLAQVAVGNGKVFTYYKNDKGRVVEHQFASFRVEGLKPIAKKVYREDKEGRVPGGLRPLWIERGLQTWVVKKEGEYDKARDMKRPDRLARLDAFSGKLRDEQEIADVLAFVHVNMDHSKRPGAGTFAHVSDDRKLLLLVDGAEERALTLSRPLWMYEPETLRDQPLDGARLALSLTVDPMNPPALSRRKADVAELDLYVVDVKAMQAKLRLRIDTGGRSTAWQVVGERVTLLRKNKGFDRGGVALEVYPLSSP